MLGRRLLFAALATLVTILVGCSSGDDEQSADHEVVFPAEAYSVVSSAEGRARVEIRTSPVQPPARGVISVELRIQSSDDGAPIDGLSLSPQLWMPTMGHGASVTPQVEALGEGRYVLRNVTLYMAGQWELRTALSGALTDEVTPTFDVP